MAAPIGWVAAALLGCGALVLALQVHSLRAQVASLEGKLHAIQAPQAPQRDAPAANRPAPRPATQVYVRPHPPNFLEGRWVFFHSYAKIMQGESEKVVFYRDGKAPLVVNSEAVDWPQQKAATVLK